MPVEPTAAKFPGQTIPAIRFAVTDREAYRPVRTSLLLIDEIRRQHPRDFAWTPHHRPPDGLGPGEARHRGRLAPRAAGGVGPGSRAVRREPQARSCSIPERLHRHASHLPLVRRRKAAEGRVAAELPLTADSASPLKRRCGEHQPVLPASASPNPNSGHPSIRRGHHHPITPSHHHTITPSHHHTITPSHHHTITPSHHHTITPSHHHTITPSHHHTSQASSPRAASTAARNWSTSSGLVR